ncbi:MAG: hypothetical protein U0Q04_02100 [Microbacterium sp.]
MTTPDIRLIAVDMDGTLLLPDGSIPEGIWPLLDGWPRAALLSPPRVGGKLATLQRMFARVPRRTRLHRRERRVRRAR